MWKTHPQLPLTWQTSDSQYLLPNTDILYTLSFFLGVATWWLSFGIEGNFFCWLVGDLGLISDSREESQLWITNMSRITVEMWTLFSKCQRETYFVFDMSYSCASVAVYITWDMYLYRPPAIIDHIPLRKTETQVHRLNYRAWGPEISRLHEEQLCDVSGRFLLPDHRPDPPPVAAPLCKRSWWM